MLGRLDWNTEEIAAWLWEQERQPPFLYNGCIDKAWAYGCNSSSSTNSSRHPGPAALCGAGRWELSELIQMLIGPQADWSGSSILLLHLPHTTAAAAAVSWQERAEFTAPCPFQSASGNSGMNVPTWLTDDIRRQASTQATKGVVRMPNVTIKGPWRQKRMSAPTGQALFGAPCFENLKSFNVSHRVTSVTARVGGEVCQSRIGRVLLSVGLSQSMPLVPECGRRLRRRLRFGKVTHGPATTYCCHRPCDWTKPPPHYKEARGKQSMSSLWMMWSFTQNSDLLLWFGSNSSCNGDILRLCSPLCLQFSLLPSASWQILPLSAFQPQP